MGEKTGIGWTTGDEKFDAALWGWMISGLSRKGRRVVGGMLGTRDYLPKRHKSKVEKRRRRLIRRWMNDG